MNVGPLVTKRAEAKKIDNSLKKFLFSITKFGAKVGSLGGFKRGTHRIPSSVNEATTHFLGRLVEDDIIRTDIDNVLAEIRTELGYKRSEMSFNVDGTSGTILTPDFAYEITASLDADDPSHFDLRRELKNIKNKEIFDKAGFRKIFGSIFSNIEFHFNNDIDVGQVIDTLEDLGHQPDYDSDCESCEFSLPGVDGLILITSRSLIISGSRPIDPQKMLNNFGAFRNKLSSDKTLLTLLK